MKHNLAVLKRLHQLIDRFHTAFDGNNRSLIGNPLRFFRLISDELEEFKKNGLLTEDMAQSYTNILQEMMNNNGDYSDNTEERFDKLYEINNQQIEACVAADKKMSEVFNVNWKDNNTQTKDTEKGLQHISDLMRFYQNSYEQNGALESVDLFCEIASGIKDSVENETISEKTAKELFEQLEFIKKDYFDDVVRKHYIEGFNNILRYRLEENKLRQGHEEFIKSVRSFINKKERNEQQTDVAKTKEKTEKTDEAKTQGDLESIVDGIRSLNIGKEETQHTMTASDAVKTQDEADKVLESQRQASKGNPGRGNEAKEKAVREQVSKNEEQKQGAKSEKDHSLDSLNKAIEDYTFLLANGLSVYPAWVDLRKEIKSLVDKGVITQQKAEEFKGIFVNYDKASRLKILNEIRNNDDYFVNKQSVIIASQDQARVDDAFKPQEEQKSQDKFSAFRAQLERKVPLEKDENTDNKKIDKPAAFKAGIGKTKNLAESRRKAMMNYYMKKREAEWDDH